MTMHAPSRTRSQNLLYCLEDAICFSTGSAGNIVGYRLGGVLSVGEYSLPNSLRQSYEQRNRRPRTTLIQDWAEQYARDGPSNTESFLFPENTAGPDLLFILEKKNGNGTTSRLLCAVQVCNNEICELIQPVGWLWVLTLAKVKTGGFTLPATMNTLRPKGWYKANNERNSTTNQDYEDHPSPAHVSCLGGIPIVLILLCTNEEVDKVKLHDWVRSRGRSMNRNHFYCALDMKIVKDMWGSEFVNAARAVKGNGNLFR